MRLSASGKPKVIRELGGVFELIADNPRMARIYEGRTHQFVHGKHIILYRIGSDSVVIGRVFHGAQSSSRKR